MVKHRDKWGTVCDDGFEEVSAQAACLTMGYSGMVSYSTHNTRYSDSSYPTNLDNVICKTNTTNFLECPHNSWGNENCGHSEDILLTCK